MRTDVGDAPSPIGNLCETLATPAGVVPVWTQQRNGALLIRGLHETQRRA
jgi:hypothetical protein